MIEIPVTPKRNIEPIHKHQSGDKFDKRCKEGDRNKIDEHLPHRRRARTQARRVLARQRRAHFTHSAAERRSEQKIDEENGRAV